MREKEPSTGIIFVRHGQTDFPTDRIYRDDVEDPALNEAGVAGEVCRALVTGAADCGHLCQPKRPYSHDGPGNLVARGC